MTETKQRLWTPFLLTAFILAADQITKALVVRHIPYHTVGHSFFDGLLRIIHTRNLAIAFSIGSTLPDTLRSVLFIVFPLLVMIFLVVYYFKTDEITPFQRWCLAAVLGGGVGNIIDRIFRPLGVVDFIDVKFFGIFGLERWPTFNVADSSVVVAGILLALSMLLGERINNRRTSSG
ncbi:MAG: signal peptidase II [Spirochaetales bacterium]|nr:signal peptidase II [Spirochaetales bacterium]